MITTSAPFAAFSYARRMEAAEKAMATWLETFRTASEFTLWWTQKCIQAPATFAAMAAPMTRTLEDAPASAPAPIVDLAEAVATRAATATLEAAEAVVETAEAAVEQTVAVTLAAAEELTPDPDDLTQLVGIGPKLAAALAERGVTRFAHIAAWTEADLAEVDKALDLKGRAVRDAWVAQAKRFGAA